MGASNPVLAVDEKRLAIVWKRGQGAWNQVDRQKHCPRNVPKLRVFPWGPHVEHPHLARPNQALGLVGIDFFGQRAYHAREAIVGFFLAVVHGSRSRAKYQYLPSQTRPLGAQRPQGAYVLVRPLWS